MDRTLSEVAKVTGAKKRTIQVWADTGLIHPSNATSRRGTGVHRRFSEGEVKVAALLTPLANLGLTIGQLEWFAALFRDAVMDGEGNHRDSPEQNALRELRRADLDRPQGRRLAHRELNRRLVKRLRDRNSVREILRRALEGRGCNYLLFAHGAGRDDVRYDFVTDENGPPRVDVRALSDVLSPDSPVPFLGVINLNVAFGGLRADHAGT